jgi:hypothetical protein
MANEESSEFAAFVSHSSNDVEVAMELVESLENSGKKCWIAPRNIAPGSDYPTELVRAIKRCKCIIVLISESANRSDPVKRELELAYRYNKPIFPVRLEDVPPGPELEFFVSSLQWVDVWQGHLKDYVGFISQAISEGTLPAEAFKAAPKRKLRIGAGQILLAGVGLAVVAVLYAIYQSLNPILDAPIIPDTTSRTQNLREPEIRVQMPPVSGKTPATDLDAIDWISWTRCTLDVSSSLSSYCTIPSNAFMAFNSPLQTVWIGRDADTLQPAFLAKEVTMVTSSASGGRQETYDTHFVTPPDWENFFFQYELANGDRTAVYEKEGAGTRVNYEHLRFLAIGEDDATRAYLTYGKLGFGQSDGWFLAFPFLDRSLLGSLSQSLFEYDFDGRGYLDSEYRNLLPIEPAGDETPVKIKVTDGAPVASGEYEYQISAKAFLNVATETLLRAAKTEEPTCRRTRHPESRENVVLCYWSRSAKNIRDNSHLLPVIDTILIGSNPNGLDTVYTGSLDPETMLTKSWADLLSCNQQAIEYCADGAYTDLPMYFALDAETTDVYYQLRLIDGSTTDVNRIRIP